MDLSDSVVVDGNKLDYILGKGYSDTKIINTKTSRVYNTEIINDYVETLENDRLPKTY